jgi:hypothetical protein
MVPVCACGECGDERKVSGELKKEKRVNVARRYCCGCEVCCWAGSSICICWRGWLMNEESASISRVFVVGFSTFIAEARVGGTLPLPNSTPTSSPFLPFPPFPFFPPHSSSTLNASTAIRRPWILALRFMRYRCSMVVWLVFG